MTEEKVLELINKEIDGFNSPEESESLRQYLSKNPEARAIHGELSSVAQMLELVDEQEPPVNLKKNILNSLDPDLHVARAISPRREPQVGWFQSLFSLRFGLTFGTGLAVGLLFFVMLGQQQPADFSSLSGAMLQKDAPTGFTTIATFPISVTEAQGEVALRGSGNLVRLELQVTSTQKLDAAIGYQAGSIGFRGIAHLDGQAVGPIGVESDQVLLGDISAKQYVVIFDRKSSAAELTVNLRLTDSGKVVYSQVLPTSTP